MLLTFGFLNYEPKHFNLVILKKSICMTNAIYRDLVCRANGDNLSIEGVALCGDNMTKHLHEYTTVTCLYCRLHSHLAMQRLSPIIATESHPLNR